MATAKAKNPAGRGQTAAADPSAGLGVEGAAVTLAATDTGGNAADTKRRQPWFKSLL